MTERSTLPGLYVHLPFCTTICPYCDFYVLTGDRARRRRYLSHLLAEIGLCKGSPWPPFVDPAPEGSFDTLYLGGGTPSVFDADDLSTLHGALSTILPLDGKLWIGLEANPEDVTRESLASWKGEGIRFLSLGIQSFNRRVLEFLGRCHDPEDCRKSVLLSRESGIETLSVDLIYGLPGQTADDWQADLDAAVELEPDHLSCYQLTVEPGTPFGFRRDRNQLTELVPEQQAELFLLTHKWLAERGYVAYEISNFALSPAHRSRHNMKYWQHTPYLGLGPSAHSYAAQTRWWNVRKIKPYGALIDADRRPIDDHEALSQGQLRLEHLMLGLRTPEGVDFCTFPGAVGARLWHRNRALVEDLVEADLVAAVGQRLIPTLAGLAVAEAMACRFDLLDP